LAYLDDRELCCPGCGKRGAAVFVVGVGPNTGPGEGPAYITLHTAGPWQVEEITAHPFFAGRLLCPDCGAEVLNRPKGQD